MDTSRPPRRLLLVPEPAQAAPDDLSAPSSATTAEAPRPRVRRYRLARLGDGSAGPPSRPRRRP